MARRQGRKPGRNTRERAGNHTGQRPDRADGTRSVGGGHRSLGAGGGGARKSSDRGFRTSRTRGANTARYIEGRRACAEALEAGVPLRRALVARAGSESGSAADRTLAQLVERVAARGVEVEAVPRAQLDALSSHGAHQGILLETRPFAYATLDEVIAAAQDAPNALVVVLDHVVDEGNLGAIVRSAEVVGATGVVVARARAAGVGPGAYKASAGAVLHLPIAQVANIATAVGELREAGFFAVAATEHAERCVWDVSLAGRIVLVMGAEATGVSRLVRERCDLACRLPQHGRVESLNVAQAATALCYEWLRRTTQAGE